MNIDKTAKRDMLITLLAQDLGLSGGALGLVASVSPKPAKPPTSEAQASRPRSTSGGSTRTRSPNRSLEQKREELRAVLTALKKNQLTRKQLTEQGLSNSGISDALALKKGVNKKGKQGPGGKTYSFSGDVNAAVDVRFPQKDQPESTQASLPLQQAPQQEKPAPARTTSRRKKKPAKKATKKTKRARK